MIGKHLSRSLCGAAAGLLLTVAMLPSSAQAQKKPKNIIFIMGDDIGWFNIGAYHQGIMAGRTPNLDTAGRGGHAVHRLLCRGELHGGPGELHHRRAAHPHRPDHGRPGGLADRHAGDRRRPSPRRSSRMGYATGQFGKNHLGDLNEFLPTVHGFDEFFGYLYHLDAMEDPATATTRRTLKDTVGPRNMVHSWATDIDDPTVQPRWGKIGKQKIEDAGTLYPERMETVDDEILANALKFVDKAKGDGKPFFLWLNPTRMHVVTHLSDKYEKMRTPENGWSIQEAGMAQLDDIVGSVMKYLKDNGLEDEHHHRLHDRQRRRELHLARRRPDAVRRRQGHGAGRRLPRALHRPLARQGPGGQGRERHHLRPRLVPDLRRRRRRSRTSPTS